MQIGLFGKKEVGINTDKIALMCVILIRMYRKHYTYPKKFCTISAFLGSYI